jgi:hypothetical protein
MRDTLSQTEFVHQADKYFKLIDSKSLEIQDIHPVTDDCVMVTHKAAEDYNEGNNVSNLAIAALTTSHARLVLLEMLNALGDRVLYYDTDSVIYVYKPGDWEPAEGVCLGEWSNELKNPGEHILRFVSLGSKVYAYDTSMGNSVQKYKSITQCQHTENILEADPVTGELKATGKKLCFDMQKSLLDGSQDKQVIIIPDSIARNGKTQAITSVSFTKTLRKVYTKRWMLPDFSSLPFGTRVKN